MTAEKTAVDSLEKTAMHLLKSSALPVSTLSLRKQPECTQAKLWMCGWKHGHFVLDRPRWQGLVSTDVIMKKVFVVSTVLVRHGCILLHCITVTFHPCSSGHREKIHVGGLVEGRSGGLLPGGDARSVWLRDVVNIVVSKGHRWVNIETNIE